MTSDDAGSRYVFRTRGVCPPEIHFQIQGNLVKDIRFVGGGCPGNARLVSRLLDGKPLEQALEFLKDIACRNDTSCPEQLARGLVAATDGALEPARSFRLHLDPQPRNRIGLIGELDGGVGILESVLRQISLEEVEVIYCLGNLTGKSDGNKKAIEIARKQGIQAIQGETDWLYAQGSEDEGFPPLEQKERDFLLCLPQVMSFQIGKKRGLAFYGNYIQGLPGFSDFEPYALEINMVCGLTRFMQDEAVFPALEAMVPQFEAKVIIFGQACEWGHWRIGDTDFIGVGPAWNGSGPTFGLLQGTGKEIAFKVWKPDVSIGEKHNG